MPYAFARASREAPTGGVTFDLTGANGEPVQLESPGAETIVRGPVHDLCLIAARRRTPSETAITATGPDGDAVLELVRTYA